MMDEFTKGYICAVSALVKGHGATTAAEDLLREIGKVQWKDLQSYDQEVFRHAGLRNSFLPKSKRAQ